MSGQRESVDAPSFLFPSALQATPSAISQILVVGACLTTSYVKAVQRLAPQVNVRHVMFNNVAKLPDMDEATLASLDFQQVMLPLREIVTDRIIRFCEFQNGEAESVMQGARTRLRLFLAAAMQHNKSHGLLTFVSNFIVPQRPVVAALDQAGTEFDFCWVVRELNQELGRLVRSYQNAFLADVDSIGASIGKRHFQDDVVAFYSHAAHWMAAFTEYEDHPAYNAVGRLEPLPDLEALYGFRGDDLFAALWRQAESMYRSVRQIDTVKMVVFDLDDTLWRGQIAEHYGEGAKQPVIHGWPVGLWEAVQHLRARGIIVALCSKNDEGLVRQRWARAVKEQWLKFDDFALREINWHPKAENIAKLIQRAALTPKSVVFVDDNPVERESVKAALPGIRVIGSDPYATRRILLWSPETQVARRSTEAALRENSVRQMQVREEARSAMSREEFLQSLQCKVSVDRIGSPQHAGFERSFELLNKTNQFNTTGKRWSPAEMFAFFSGGGVVYSVRVQDVFTDYGLVGVVLYRQGQFVQFAMSCRVLGLEIETSVLRFVMRQARDGEAQAAFSACVEETEANMVCRDVFLRCGFVADGHHQTHAGEIAAPAGHLAMYWVSQDACAGMA